MTRRQLARSRRHPRCRGIVRVAERITHQARPAVIRIRGPVQQVFPGILRQRRTAPSLNLASPRNSMLLHPKPLVHNVIHDGYLWPPRSHPSPRCGPPPKSAAVEGHERALPSLFHVFQRLLLFMRSACRWCFFKTFNKIFKTASLPCFLTATEPPRPRRQVRGWGLLLRAVKLQKSRAHLLQGQVLLHQVVLHKSRAGSLSS